MQLSSQRVLRLLQPMFIGGCTMALALSGVSALSAWREASSPHVGDMIAFRPTGGERSGKRLEVRTSTGEACVLDLGTLRGLGGSLIVEGPGPGSSFVVHWAGTRTSLGAGDCGASADIVLDAQELELLGVAALASGGQTDTAA